MRGTVRRVTSCNFETWSHTNIVPKVHISSLNQKEFRAHAEYIDLEFIKPFLHVAKINHNFDIMIESKQKDLAMLQFIQELSSIRGIKRISSSTLQW